MNEKTMGAIPVSALERLEQSAVKLSLITFCLRHEELKAAPDAAEIHSIKSDLSRALQEVSANATACALSGGIPEKPKASPPAGAEPKRVQWGDGNMRDCSICKARAYCWEAVEPGSIMCGINLMQHGGTKSEPETPRSISVKLSPTFCAYCGKPLKIVGTERFCNNVQCFNRFQNV